MLLIAMVQKMMHATGMKMKRESGINMNGEERYHKGFDILMDYWDCIPDEEKMKVHERLMKIGL
jgi:hypothetical protein